MVSSILTALALAVATLTSAAPTTHSEPFTFAKWIDGIIANPDGDNLSPEQAVDDGASLQKRWSCNTIPNTEAWVPDAVSCIDDLARKGSQACVADSVSRMCRIGNAQITGVSNGQRASSTCNDVARGAGVIMDHCTRADNYVQGSEWAYGSDVLLVHIRWPDSEAPAR
ncbi:hypothetical protein CkaCkLH20_05320 [Colletotrichum karsti]|uniref:Uncharacterized protein n=1 Tax=Colletotrichum karsti TaxID=1095194 RepID=A0A9P6I6C1_9PEZI|nr:uncharacterized protein CkaCkLH20_05320 [Colletotrichum karsti]KAF9877054.1 hypothetical protein CkaCkLH20_05320 [Colletotrichum karsti]